MAVSLAQLAGGPQNPGGVLQDGLAYKAYAMACMERGDTPLPYAQWVAAGKPGG